MLSFRRRPGADGNGWMPGGAGMAGKLQVMATPAIRAGWWIRGRRRKAAGRRRAQGAAQWLPPARIKVFST